MSQRALALFSVLLSVGLSNDDDVARRLTGSAPFNEGLEVDDQGLELQDQSSNEQRRLLPPYLGAENQPCRNYVYGYPQCDPGLSCSETNHGSFTTGICVRPESPKRGARLRGQALQAPRWLTAGELRATTVIVPRGSDGRRRLLPPYFGAENQPCRNYVPGYPQCDPGLSCSETNLCVRRENKGGEGQQCRGSYPRCNDQLCPAETRGYSCVCELPMPGPFGAVCPGDVGAGAPGSSGRRRILPPYLGAENQPCRNYQPGYPQCDPGLTCSETNHGSFTTGICVRREQYGGEGQKCQGWNTCNRGLKPEWSWFPIIECRCARNYRRGLDNSSEDALESSEDALAAPETTRRLGELGFAHIDRQVGLKN